MALPRTGTGSAGSGARAAVTALGVFSALALLAASFADFGDPLASARAEAQQVVRAR